MAKNMVVIEVDLWNMSIFGLTQQNREGTKENGGEKLGKSL